MKKRTSHVYLRAPKAQSCCPARTMRTKCTMASAVPGMDPKRLPRAALSPKGTRSHVPCCATDGPHRWSPCIARCASAPLHQLAALAEVSHFAHQGRPLQMSLGGAKGDRGNPKPRRKQRGISFRFLGLSEMSRLKTCCG